MKQVVLHGGGCGSAVANEDGVEDFAVIGDGLVFGDESVAVAEAGLQEVGKRLH